MTRDLMFKDEIQRLVADAYRQLDTPGGSAIGLYDRWQLQRVPPTARDWALGVGNPVLHAGIVPGETILDLGCGAGIDVILAAHEAGPTGLAVGVDLLESMTRRAGAAAREAGLSNARFITAEIEALPLPHWSTDVVISNGAVNLSGRKSRVLAEAYRVLRPGGRLCVSDLTVSEDDLPPEIITHPSAWAG